MLMKLNEQTLSLGISKLRHGDDRRRQAVILCHRNTRNEHTIKRVGLSFIHKTKTQTKETSRGYVKTMETYNEHG